jgi:hypothetical protein
VTFTRVLQRIRYLLHRSDCFRPSDRLAGWDSHPLEIADFHGVLSFRNVLAVPECYRVDEFWEARRGVRHGRRIRLARHRLPVSKRSFTEVRRKRHDLMRQLRRHNQLPPEQSGAPFDCAEKLFLAFCVDSNARGIHAKMAAIFQSSKPTYLSSL